jgi:hypothetical protein
MKVLSQMPRAKQSRCFACNIAYRNPSGGGGKFFKHATVWIDDFFFCWDPWRSRMLHTIYHWRHAYPWLMSWRIPITWMDTYFSVGTEQQPAPLDSNR